MTRIEFTTTGIEKFLPEDAAQIAVGLQSRADNLRQSYVPRTLGSMVEIETANDLDRIAAEIITYIPGYRPTADKSPRPELVGQDHVPAFNWKDSDELWNQQDRAELDPEALAMFRIFLDSLKSASDEPDQQLAS